MQKTQGPNIYEADNFRYFLESYYKHRKEKNSKFSYQAFSRLLGFKARSYLPLVISGKRNIDPSQIERFAVLFNNSSRQFNLFKDLVTFEWAKHPAEKAKIAKKILQAKKSQKISSLKFEWYCLYSDWYYFPLLYLAGESGFRPDVDNIQQKLLFPITQKQIRDAIEVFFKLGIWKTESDGIVTLTEKTLNSYQELDRTVLKGFHIKMLEKAMTAADLPFNERYLSGTTLALSDKKFQEFSDEVHELKKDLYLKYSTDDTRGDKTTDCEMKKIYQLSLTVFPLTK
jgi:uncharacterized protein (TIGR02147 family)